MNTKAELLMYSIALLDVADMLKQVPTTTAPGELVVRIEAWASRIRKQAESMVD